MTPQLQQAIKLLQLSNMELASFVEKELEQNPLLDRDDGTGLGNTENQAGSASSSDLISAEPSTDGPQPSTADNTAFSGDEAGASSQPDSMDLQASDTLPDNNSSPLDTDYDSYYDESPDNKWGESDTAFSNWGPGGNTRFDDESNSLENRLTSELTLREHLLQQLGVEIEATQERLIGAHLIEQLDDSGYLSTPLAEIAWQLNCPEEQVEAVLEKLQRFDPIGVFARDLRECLSLQLREQNRLDPMMETFLDHLELLANRDLKGLMKACKADQEDIADMITEIRNLNPRPCQSFETVTVEPIIPDVLVKPDNKGGWHIELNTEALPKVLVNTGYYNHVQSRDLKKDELSYLSEQYQTANWLVKALHQRATTILKVSSEIVRMQDGFLKKGVQALRPLTLKDVAEAIEMHESTVSRVTSNKYLVTPRGTFELKYFFTSSVGGANGDAHSAESVKARIKALIDEEPAKKPLSDDALVKLLKAEGIDIARRTVAKYREAIGIGSSSQRRKEKAFQL